MLQSYQSRVVNGPISWKYMTTDNNLGMIARNNPHLGSIAITQLIAARSGKQSLNSLLSTISTKKFDTDDEYTWDVLGSNNHNVPLVEARDEDGTVVNAASGMIGANTRPFYLVFAEDWFFYHETIVGDLNEVYQFRIIEEPVTEGTNYVYKVELTGGNIDGCPAERLLVGERFSYEAAFVTNTLSRRAGGVRFTSPVGMRNEWSSVRIHHKASGNMINKHLKVGLPICKEVNGKLEKKVITTWMHYEDYVVEETFEKYKNNGLMFGRSNRNRNGEYTNFDNNGLALKTGAGLLEQIECANTMTYNKFSLKLVETALYNISSNLDYGERSFILRTGEMGAIEFHKAVLNETSGWTAFTLDNSSTNVVRKTQSELHSNSLSAGYQFTEFLAPNGVKLKVVVDKWYDDKERNKIQHPDGGPAMSYRFDIMYQGSNDEPNIFKTELKNKPEYRGYQWGFRNPFTNEVDNNNMSYDEDSAEIHKFAQFGVCVLDPTRTVSLIPNILR